MKKSRKMSAPPMGQLYPGGDNCNIIPNNYTSNDIIISQEVSNKTPTNKLIVN